MRELIFTDDEKRIFLAAIEREMKVCREVDNEIGDSGVNLVEICKGIQRKVILSELWLSDSI